MSSPALATTFYDWSGDGGVGFLEAGPIADPANFINAPLIDFSFQFQPGGGTVSLADVEPSPIAPTIVASVAIGAITQLNITHTGPFINAEAATLSFTDTVSICSSLPNASTFCSGTLGESAFFTGEWVLRTSTVPSPATLALFTLGLAGLGVRRKA